ncbi:hypothetical protein [Pseudorhodoferax sp.]|uniref:hypothetical protein n=1 Tax=Pseudorhodoferax sp. TaxID=1993553 RepID=UPI0039E2BCC4
MFEITDAPEAAADALRQLAGQAGTPCDSCATLDGSGWQAVPAGLDRARLQALGRLPAPDSADGTGQDATLDEWHPQRTRYWSPEAPVALGWFPCNRAGVWRCTRCAAVLLRYTEYGGYYEEERVRRVRADLVAAPAH